MHPKERLMGLARAYQLRGVPIPTDMLVEAERLGLILSELDQPILEGEDNENGEN